MLLNSGQGLGFRGLGFRGLGFRVYCMSQAARLVTVAV